MEKKAVVEAKYSPSIISGKTSDIVKNGCALCNGETDTVTVAEKKLAKAMSKLYNDGRDAVTDN